MMHHSLDIIMAKEWQEGLPSYCIVIDCAFFCAALRYCDCCSINLPLIKKGREKQRWPLNNTYSLHHLPVLRVRCAQRGITDSRL